MSRRPPGTIELLSPDPATPARVARTASLVLDALIAAAGEAAANNATLVVSNFKMSVEVRPQQPDAKSAVDTIAAVLKNAHRAVERIPEARDVARALSNIAVDEIFPQGLYAKHPRSREPFAHIDGDFVRMAKALAASEPAPIRLLKGDTEVHTKIFRIGRINDSEPLKVRLTVDGKTADLQVETATDLEPFLRAIVDGSWAVVELAATWVRHAEDLEMDFGKTKVIGIRPWNPVSGKEFLTKARESLPSLLEADTALITSDREADR
jgi:hypothetical protein